MPLDASLRKTNTESMFLTFKTSPNNLIKKFLMLDSINAEKNNGTGPLTVPGSYHVIQCLKLPRRVLITWAETK